MAPSGNSNSTLNGIKRFFPQLPNSTWRVGVSPWARVRPECFDPTLNCHTGVELEILYIVATLLNATLQFKITPYPGCGYRTANGKWLGLMGMLENDEVDITGNVCTVDEWRLNTSFSKASLPVVRDRQCFLVKLPQPVFDFSITAPFDSLVWYLLLLSIAVYIFMNSFSIFIFSSLTFKRSIVQSLVEVITVSTNQEIQIDRPKLHWFIWICYVIFFAICYSTYITGALIRAVIVDRPFRDNIELAENLYEGKYRYLDYHKENVAYPKCYNETCNLFKKAIGRNGYHLVNSSDSEATNKMITELLQYDDLVLAKGRITLDYYLDSYKNRSMLWIIDDILAGEQWSVFYFKRNFELAEFIDKALILIGDYKNTVYGRYSALSKMTFDGKQVKGDPPTEARTTFHHMVGPLIIYAVGFSCAVSALMIEIIYKKKYKKFHTNLLF